MSIHLSFQGPDTVVSPALVPQIDPPLPVASDVDVRPGRIINISSHNELEAEAHASNPSTPL